MYLGVMPFVITTSFPSKLESTSQHLRHIFSISSCTAFISRFGRGVVPCRRKLSPTSRGVDDDSSETFGSFKRLKFKISEPLIQRFYGTTNMQRHSSFHHRLFLRKQDTRNMTANGLEVIENVAKRKHYYERLSASAMQPVTIGFPRKVFH